MNYFQPTSIERQTERNTAQLLMMMIWMTDMSNDVENNGVIVA
jgi:hypothetical protein